jgi:hypothetical protein
LKWRRDKIQGSQNKITPGVERSNVDSRERKKARV